MRFTLASAIFFVFLVVELSIGLPVTKNRNEETKNAPGDHHETHPRETGVPERTALEEERRIRVELLRQYYNRKRELESGEYLDPFKHRENGDPAQIHAVEIAELDRAIAKTTSELSNIDHKRRELFKEYEIQKKIKEMQEEKGNAGLDEEKRKKFHEEHEKLREKHKKHESINHPLSEPQLEEVWEREDDIQQKFDSETFFNIHDVDGNKVWDQTEVASLFKIELEKMYEKGMPEDDLRERDEEMERMREHVFQEADTNRNGLIEYDEFLKQIQKPESKNEGWEGLDEKPLYTPEELDMYIRNHPDPEAAYAALNGLAPPQNGINYHQAPLQQHGDPNAQYHQGQVPHPVQYQNQIPQQYQQHQGQQIPDHNQPIKVPLYQQQQQAQYQHAPVQQQQQVLHQQQYQMPPQQVPRDQIPPEQQYHHQVVQQTQQVQQNIPNQPHVQQQQQQQQQQQPQQQPPQSVQPQQQIVNQDHNTQNQAAINQPVIQQQQQQPHHQQHQQQQQQHK